MPTPLKDCPRRKNEYLKSKNLAQKILENIHVNIPQQVMSPLPPTPERSLTPAFTGPISPETPLNEPLFCSSPNLMDVDDSNEEHVLPPLPSMEEILAVEANIDYNFMRELDFQINEL